MAGVPRSATRCGAAQGGRGREAPTLTVAVFGTGALASLVGARLARAGTDVALVGTWPEALEAITRSGIRVEDSGGAWVAHPRAMRPGAAESQVGLSIVLVKSYQTQAVAPAVAAMTRDDGLVLSLQNGIGNRECLAGVAGSARVALGAAVLGATLVGPAHVRAGGGSRIVLQGHPRIGVAAARLGDAGFETSLADDIERALWQKLVANCAINPLTAIHRVPNGALLDGAERQATVEAAAREVALVARALGIEIGDDPAGLALAVARSTAENRSSMLQDVENGRPTEIEALNAAVVGQAAVLGIAVPVNRRLAQAVRELGTHAPAG